ncbi:MAG: hypothetical protein JW780_04760 [Clostridiales bacterium]|nr:hypothetical protein [Clostridiales bacterium]
MKYGRGFKEAILRKVLPPENQPVRRFGKENGISGQTIRNRMMLVKDGKMDGTLNTPGTGAEIRRDPSR